MNRNEIVSVGFISSFGGQQSYLIRTRAGSHRVEAHYPESDYHRSISCYKGADYDKHVATRIGCYTGASEMLTLDVAVEFNRLRFAERDAQVQTILSNKERYGEYDPFAEENLFTVLLPASYNLSDGWVALFSFEELRDLAGIPAERCTSLYSGDIKAPANNQVAA